MTISELDIIDELTGADEEHVRLFAMHRKAWRELSVQRDEAQKELAAATEKFDRLQAAVEKAAAGMTGALEEIRKGGMAC